MLIDASSTEEREDKDERGKVLIAELDELEQRSSVLCFSSPGNCLEHLNMKSLTTT